MKWACGKWIQSHNLTEVRGTGVSWATPSGVYLMGGYSFGSGNTSTLVKEDGSVVEGFDLKYQILYVLQQYLKPYFQLWTDLDLLTV